MHGVLFRLNNGKKVKMPKYIKILKSVCLSHNSVRVNQNSIENIGKVRVKITDVLTFKEYAEFGVPVMFIFLTISSLYVSILYYFRLLSYGTKKHYEN